MRMWVRGNPYLKAIARAAPRVDLDGNAAGVPTPEEITQAINEIFKRTGETLKPPRAASPYAHPDFKRAKTILISFPLGVPLAGDERDFMLGVLTRHPEAGRKSAEGATGILVNEHRKSGNRCFFLIRADGVTESFSLVKCFEASTPRTQAASPSSPANPVTPTRPATPEIVEATVRVKAAKVIVPVRIEQFPKIDVPEGAKAPAGVDLVLKSGEVALHATINRKSFRKAMRTIEESPAGTFVVVQGALGLDGTILEAGMVVQPPKGEAAKSGEA
jgi:sRNA-binding protein